MRLLSRPTVTAALLLGAATLAVCSAPPVNAQAPSVGRSRLPSVGNAADADPTARAANPAPADQPFVTPERLSRGYTIVVVGVNGDNMLSAGLAPGLAEGGYPGAVEVVDWTTGFWPLFVYHLRAARRHRAAAEQIAGKIAAYQARYPGREVNLVGFSAGAVVAAKAVEAMPEGRRIDRVVFLAGAISPLYDLRTVLARTRVGVWSYYQPQDLVALWAGTLVAGTADGHHIVSAGAVGFWTPVGLSEDERRRYDEKLVQAAYRPQMIASGNLGGHFQCVGRRFVAAWIAPILTGEPARDVAQSPDRKLR
jgi:hypothetical protein